MFFLKMKQNNIYMISQHSMKFFLIRILFILQPLIIKRLKIKKGNFFCNNKNKMFKTLQQIKSFLIKRWKRKKYLVNHSANKIYKALVLATQTAKRHFSPREANAKTSPKGAFWYLLNLDRSFLISSLVSSNNQAADVRLVYNTG